MQRNSRSIKITYTTPENARPVSLMSFDTNIVKSIEVFVAVAESGKTTLAAGLLGISQSAVSQHIALLERNFDVTLFDRSVRPVRLTQAGLLFHRHAMRF